MKGQSCYVSGRGNYLGRALALVSAGLLKPETELRVPMARTRSEANGGGAHYNHYITGQSSELHASHTLDTLSKK